MKDRDRKRIAAAEQATRKAAAYAFARQHPDLLMTADRALDFVEAVLAGVRRNVTDPVILAAIRRDIGEELGKHGIVPDPPDGGERKME